MTTVYHGHYSGWTRSEAEEAGAARKGSREEGGGVVKPVLAYEAPSLGLALGWMP